MLPGRKKIKILYEIGPYTLGGSERFLFKLIKYLNKEKFEPVAISHNKGKPLSLFKSLGIQTEVLKFNHATASNQLLQFIKENKIDIAQSNYYSFSVAMTAYVAGIPHIWRLGGHIETACPSLNLQEKRYVLHTISRLSQKIICPSKFIKKQFEDIKNAKTNLIYNGTEILTKNNPSFRAPNKLSSPNAFIGDPLDSRLKRAGMTGILLSVLDTKTLFNGHYSIGMIGNFFPEKRHLDFIHAAQKVKKEFPQSKFFIFGSAFYPASDPSYTRCIKKTIRDLHMQKDMILSGFLNDIHREIEQMDLIVLPSIGEGFSNAILEAMALGKVVVASNSGGNPELIENGETGFLVPPKNPEKLAEAMLKILKNQKKVRELGKAAKKRVKKMFDITACVRKYENLYLQVYGKT